MRNKYVVYERSVQYRPPVKQYSAMAFIGDLIMFCLTGGLWLIWIFVREMRRR